MNPSSSEINSMHEVSLGQGGRMGERVESSPAEAKRRVSSERLHKPRVRKDGKDKSRHQEFDHRKLSLADSIAETAPSMMSSFLSPSESSPSVSGRSMRADPASLLSSASLPFTSPHKRTSAGNLNLSISSVQSAKDGNIVPSIYKFARKCQWTEFSKALASDSGFHLGDIGFVYKKDGTTVLHMAVMSRTGYITAFKSCDKEFPMAPLEVIEELLQLDPEVANVKCTLNGYTPLTYACLVCNNHYDVEDAAKMVRLFLKYCPESVKMFTKEGLSPVDIHVVSYSHHHQAKEEESSLGRTSASVLRTLLTHSPELANNRVHGDKVKGPLELLYKCNANVFSQAVMEELNSEATDEGTVRSEFTIPERRQKVVDAVKKWWIWTWAIMILKYGSLKQKKRGSQFAAMHSACMQIACPAPILSLILFAFPRQIKQPILDKDDKGNLPLHAVCSWPGGPAEKAGVQTLLSTRKSQAISRVIDEFPQAVKSTNGQGETALELAAKSGTSWDGGVRRLVKAYPKALRIASEETGLYPFMTAATAADKGNDTPVRDAQCLRTIYGLLRANPRVLSQCLEE
eukprot:Nitzschia sp. Nitz4//scaffold44_size153857//87113//88831//NITZ4_002730-RA/size153857-processed-gene-0.104-mRNA-1//-1//CDS//3329552184//2030//frame0